MKGFPLECFLDKKNWVWFFSDLKGILTINFNYLCKFIKFKHLTVKNALQTTLT